MGKIEKKIDGSRKPKRVTKSKINAKCNPKRDTKKKKAIQSVTKRNRLKAKTKAKKGGQPENKNAEKWTEEVLLKVGDGLFNWMLAKESNVFMREYLLINHGITIDHLSKYTKKYDSFCGLIKKAKEYQEIKLMKHSKRIGMPMAIFCLKANHGYKDKIDITTNDKDINEKLPDLSHLGIDQLRKLHGELNKQGD